MRLYDVLRSKFSPRNRLFLLEGDVLDTSSDRQIRLFATNKVEVPGQFLEENARPLAVDYAKSLLGVLNMGRSPQSPHPFNRILETKDPQMFANRRLNHSDMETNTLKALTSSFSTDPLDAWYYAVKAIAKDSPSMWHRGGSELYPEKDRIFMSLQYLVRDQMSIDLENALERDMFAAGLINNYRPRT